MHVRRVANTFELFSIQNIWNDVVGECPLHSWQWLHSWWEAFEENRELFVLVCETDEHEVVGILPLCLKRRLAGGAVLTFLGSGKACTEYMSVFVKPFFESEAATAFATWLVDNQRAWDQMDLESTPTHDLTIKQLLAALHEQGAEIGAIDGDTCWRIALPDTHDEYIDSLAKRFRRKLRDAFRKVIETDTYALTTVESEDDLGDAFDRFVDLHIRRRRELGSDHCFQTAKFYDFLSFASKRLLAAGTLDIACMEINDEIASVQFGLKDDHAYYLYQSGMNPKLQQHSPGWTMNCAKIAESINSGVRYYDLLRGDEPYKRHLGATPVETSHYRIAAPRATSRIRHQLWKTKQTMRVWRDNLTPTPSER
ncbi:GNAT family N-acetyltransferase [Planctomycetota bacterium]